MNSIIFSPSSTTLHLSPPFLLKVLLRSWPNYIKFPFFFFFSSCLSPSKISREPNFLLSRQPHQILPHADIHQTQAHALVYHVPRLDPSLHALFARSAHGDLSQRRLLDHQELADFDQLLRSQAGLAHLAGVAQAGFQAVDDDHAALFGVFVVMVVVVGRDGLAQDVRVHFKHVRSVAADGADVAAFSAAFGAGEEFGGEERRDAGRAEENGVRPAHVFFQDAVVFAVICADDAEAELGVDGAQVGPIGAGVDFLQEVLRAGEAAVHNVDVMNVCASQDQSEPDVPIRLLAGPKDRDSMDFFTTVEYERGRQSRAKGRQFFGGDEGVRLTRGGEQRQGAARGSTLKARDGGICGFEGCDGGSVGGSRSR